MRKASTTVSALFVFFFVAVLFGGIGYTFGWLIHRNPNPLIKYDVDFRLWPMPMQDEGTRRIRPPQDMPFPTAKSPVT
jgi:hypothetical protein